ncbi:MAG: hypothetical protein J0M08_09790 [Bacteroidetes bacterium]|nr:hypothetical protein [Bacteroidota bacterium]
MKVGDENLPDKEETIEYLPKQYKPFTMHARGETGPIKNLQNSKAALKSKKSETPKNENLKKRKRQAR